MPYLLTVGAKLKCDHGGGREVGQAGQDLVRIDRKWVLVKGDPAWKVGLKPISGCPNMGATIKPCLVTLPETKGDSALIHIEGQRVCLDTVTGLTDGTPPGTVKYRVKRAGQGFVSGER